MAEFGSRMTEAEATPNAVTPQAGVRRAVGSSSALFAGANNLFQQYREIRQEEKTNQANAAVTRFQTEQLKLIQAVDQGKMSSRAARTRMRSNLMNEVTNNPGARADLIAANAEVLGSGGMGQMITDGTKEEIRQDRLRNDLVQNGLVSSNASEDEYQQAEQEFMSAARAQQEYDAVMDDINLSKARVGLSTAQMANLDAREQRAAENLLANSAPAHMNQFKNTAEQLLSLIGTEGYDEATVVQMIEERYNQFEEEMSGPLSQASSSTGDALMRNFREWKELALKRARGEYDQEQYNREQERIISTQQLAALQDPVISKLIATTKLGVPADLTATATPAAMRAVGNFFNQNEAGGAPANLMTDESGERKGVTEYLKMITPEGAVEDEAAREEQARHFQRVFEGVESYEGILANSPEKGIELISNWMSSQAFYRLRQENPEMVTDAAMRIIQTNYGDEVWGMIEREFTNGNVWYEPPTGSGNSRGRVQLEGRDSQPTSQVIGARSSSGGMEFYALNDDPEVRREVRRMNRNVATVINKNIKAFAHLEGTNDYGSYWDRVSELYLDGDMESDGDQDLDLGNFSFPHVSEAIPEDVANDVEFTSEVGRLAGKYEVDPSALWAVMDFETGGSFNPAQRNAAGSSATGLIQFMDKTARGLGTSTEELATMSRGEQMQYVEKYLDQYEDQIRGGSTSDLYMSVLFPKAIGKSDNYVLFRKGTTAYRQNAGLDSNGDGTVTKAEAARSVVSKVGRHRS